MFLYESLDQFRLEFSSKQKCVFKMPNSCAKRVLYLKECPLLPNEEGKLRAPKLSEYSSVCVSTEEAVVGMDV